MDYDLGEHVVCGEIRAMEKNVVMGWLGFRGRHTQTTFELTGNVDSTLFDHTTQFEIQQEYEPADNESNPALKNFFDRHIGVVERIALEEDGDQKTIHLEWFSQNGRVRLRVNDVDIFVDPDDSSEEAVEPFPFMEDDISLPSDEWQPDTDGFELMDDPFGLGPPEKDDFVREMELIDEVIEGKHQDIRIGSLFDEYGLPAPDKLDEDAAHVQMKRILAVLARFNVSFRMCPKCTWQHAYKLVHDKLFDEKLHPIMKGSSWIQHYLASELCEPCIKEFEAELDPEFGPPAWPEDNDDDVDNILGC